MSILSKIKEIFWPKQGGQHTVEFAVLLALIMTGVIVGGRYVVRSWNANLKGWEDSTIDSLQDPLTQVPDFPLPGCDPGNWITQACELTVNTCAGPVTCSPHEMTVTRAYNPVGCECGLPPPPPPTVQCNLDACCCTDPVAVQPINCGANVTGYDDLLPCQEAQGMTEKNLNGTCPDGYREAEFTCGNAPLTQRSGCIIDPLCNFFCSNPAPPPGSNPPYDGICPGDDAGLPSILGRIYIDFGACTSRKCEWQCSPGYYPSTNQWSCGTCTQVGGTLGLEKTGCPQLHRFSKGSCGGNVWWQACCNN